MINKTYKWLFDYTDGCTSNGCATADSSTMGYWTSTAVHDSYSAWGVVRFGGLDSADIANIYDFGIHPVITLSKSQVQ